MEKSATNNVKTSNYQVKNIESVMAGSNVHARLFTLAPGDVIPWHYHPETADHYFVLQGELTISTRRPEENLRKKNLAAAKAKHQAAKAASRPKSQRR